MLDRACPDLADWPKRWQYSADVWGLQLEVSACDEPTCNVRQAGELFDATGELFAPDVPLNVSDGSGSDPVGTRYAWRMRGCALRISRFSQVTRGCVNPLKTIDLGLSPGPGVRIPRPPPKMIMPLTCMFAVKSSVLIVCGG